MQQHGGQPAWWQQKVQSELRELGYDKGLGLYSKSEMSLKSFQVLELAKGITTFTNYLELCWFIRTEKQII